MTPLPNPYCFHYLYNLHNPRDQADHDDAVQVSYATSHPGPAARKYRGHANVDFFASAEVGSEIKIIATRDIAADEELLLHYGPRSSFFPNTKLLLVYGFIQPDNPGDRFLLRVAVDPKKLARAQAALQSEGLQLDIMDELTSRGVRLSGSTDTHGSKQK